MRLFYELLFPSYFRMNVAAAVVGAGVGSALISSSAAKSASNAQSRAADQANATQLQMYNQTRADNAPFLANGVAGSNKLAYLLGVGGSATGSNAAPITSLFDTSQDQWRPNADLYVKSPEYRKAYDQFIAAHQAQFNTAPASSKGSDLGTAEQQLQGYGFDLAAYNAAQNAANTATNSSDPAYGSLLKKFDQNDLNNDVVYQNGLQFGLDQGVNALNRQAAASGSYLSGAAAKALTRFGNDYGTTKANDAYNRYTNDNTNRYNKLAGISGAGQTASSQVGASGANAANQIANNQTSLGNARGASAIAGANGVNNALSQGYNMYQTNQLLDSLKNKNISVPYIGGATNQTANFNEYGTGYSP